MIKNWQEYLRYLQNKKPVKYTVSSIETTGSDATFSISSSDSTRWVTTSGSFSPNGIVTINMNDIANKTVGNDLNFIPAFKEVLPEMFQEFVNQQVGQFQVFQEKNSNYGVSNLFGGNENYEEPQNKNEALQGLYFRMRDKLTRFKELLQKENISDETIYDTLDDLANYCQISQIILKNKWGK